MNDATALDVRHANDFNGTFPALNGTLAPPNPLSPATDSPNTPVSAFTPDVKIDIDYQEQESDARNEPMPIKPIEHIIKPDNASTVPQVGTPIDSVSIPIDPPSGTPPPPPPGELPTDVQMAEEPVSNGLHNGSGPNGDVSMNDARVISSATTPEAPPESSMVSADGSQPDVLMSPANDEDMPRPAKRARMDSDADQASLAHSATPPPASLAGSPPPISAAPTSPISVPSTLTAAQFRFSQSTIRSLKKQKDAGPFLRPVDPIALNIPHYPQIIKNPMDFSTIERKLASSNLAKPDPNLQNPRYHSADEFISDVRLIFQNCYTFNGPDHAISVMGKRIEEVFDKQIKHMPPTAEPKPVKKATSPLPPPVVPALVKKTPARRASTSVPVIRRSEHEANNNRPKREIHPPPSKDLPYADIPRKQRKNKRVKDDGTVEQLRFCGKILTDLHRKQHYAIASPFYEPVDWAKLDLPSYPKLIKKPMDLSTMRKKLDNHEYSNAQKFFDDFKLMIRNCFTFNPAGTPVNQAGIELQKVFDDKWYNLPSLHDVSEDDEEDDEEDSEEDRARAIAMMESQIETMRGSIAALKGAKLQKDKKKKKEREKVQVTSNSKSSHKTSKSTSKKKNKKPINDDDVLTFEQKKDLSEAIGKLDGAKLEKVINIIHEGVPEIKDSNEEIELEIDSLPASVLTKLYNFVIRPMRAPATKRSRGKGTGTGGLKRKSMDEDVEAEKIRQLEQRMALFEQNASGIVPPATRREVDSYHSSDSSSGSESSGSDSE